MTFSFLDTTNIFERYEDARIYTNILTRPFPEFERIARNRPHNKIQKGYPRTTDGTTASIVRKTPRRVIQQIPTGTVNANDGGWLGIIAEFTLANVIIPKANDDYSFIQKCWLTIEKSLTFGACMTYTPFLNHDGDFITDVTIPYWGDVFLQPGKKSGNSCSYIFLRSWWQKSDIEELIDKEQTLAKSSKKQNVKYEPTWDIEALKQVLDKNTSKDQQAQTPAEKERAQAASGVELITGFQIGVKAKYYTFNPSSKLIVRTKTNNDPTGRTPINWMYGDTDGSNPLGRGIVELVGGLQNLIDADMQMYQYNRALALAPPLIKYGNLGNVKFAPNAIIRGTNPATDQIIPLKVDTTAIANYPALYGLQKSQLLNLVNSPDTSISSDIGNPSFSKTDAGVKQQAATISVDDNYIGKMFESWFENWATNAINIYFAEKSGIEEVQLDKITASRLRETTNFDESMISPDNKIRIDWDKESTELKFKVNPTSSKAKDSAEQMANASGLLDLVMKYPQLNSNFGGPIDVDVLSRRIVVNSGVEDPEQVAPEQTEAQKQAKEQAKNNPSPFSPMFDKPRITVAYDDLEPIAKAQILELAGVHVDPSQLSPSAGQIQLMGKQADVQMQQQAQVQPTQTQLSQPQQPQISPADQQIIQHLQSLGVPDNLVQQAMQLAEQGVPADQILAQIGFSNGR